MRNGVLSARLIVAAGSLGVASPALAQFVPPASTPVRERVAGRVLSAAGVDAAQSGDQIGVFFNNAIVGQANVQDTAQGPAFSVVIFGDNPSTAAREGPTAGQRVQFRFFDASTNTTRTDVRLENAQGRAFNYVYAGTEVPDLGGLPIPIDLTPTQTLDLRVGVGPDSGGGGGGGDGEPDAPSLDVNDDGTVNQKDVARVLRIVTGASSTLTEDELERADVNNDGVVSTADAIAIIQRP